MKYFRIPKQRRRDILRKLFNKYEDEIMNDIISEMMLYEVVTDKDYYIRYDNLEEIDNFNNYICSYILKLCSRGVSDILENMMIEYQKECQALKHELICNVLFS